MSKTQSRQTRVSRASNGDIFVVFGDSEQDRTVELLTANDARRLYDQLGESLPPEQ